MTNQTAKPLAFKVRPQQNEQYREVGDDRSTSLEVLYRGCFTPAEEIAWSEYMMKLSDQSMSEAKVDAVTLMLQKRHDPAWTRQDTESQITDFHLIELLYDFFVNERTRHAPKAQLLRVEGIGAEEIARKAAQDNNAVAATRADFKALDIWFVFRSLADIPIDFDVEEGNDFSAIEPAELAVGKRGKKAAA